ncbi:MAG: hypothetical protein KF845_07315 [Cyclobacteriaceae bacterium]|nr:hypothetical protein [Cyclobacteriaceae bacterium]
MATQKSLYIKLPLVLALILIFNYAHSQSVSTLMGARANGMGYTSAALFDSWSIFNNIAGAAKIEEHSAGFAYDLRPALPGGNRAAAALALPTSIGVISGGVFRFGDNLYNEGVLSAGFSNQFGLAALGVKINYIQYNAEGFGRSGVVSIGFGGIAEITQQLSVGAYITNINQPKISKDGDRIPTLLTAGLSFKPGKNVIIATEIEKDLDAKANWKTGVEYSFHKKFCARTGYNLEPNTIFFGLGFKTTKLAIDYAIQHTVQLNLSHQTSVNYFFTR